MVLTTYTIYKLFKQDCPDFYIGSTFDMKKRQLQHRSNCNNPNSNRYNLPVYQFIRSNGGYDSWNYEILQQFNNDLKVKDELHYIERAYIDLLKPSLNRQLPLRTMKEWFQDNKESVKLYKQQYYQSNKVAIAQKANEKFSCECGGRYTRTNKALHKKSKKHQNYINH